MVIGCLMVLRRGYDIDYLLDKCKHIQWNEVEIMEPEGRLYILYITGFKTLEQQFVILLYFEVRVLISGWNLNSGHFILIFLFSYLYTSACV